MQKDWNPVAVIDIGSNAVRLVVYHNLVRVPVQLHNERTICGLGKTLNKTGKLNPEGVIAARDSLARFSALISAMKIKTVVAVATAAMREAEDGPKFVRMIEEEFGLKINVISGDDEARLSAMGVVANHGKINGMIGDFGGGSLELIGVESGKIISQDSLPLGALRIMAQDSAKAQKDYINEHLDRVDLSPYKGQRFYILGGAWRTLARAHIFMEKYPITVLDNYRLETDSALKFAKFISAQNETSLERMAGLTKRRVKDMPAAALVLKHVLERLEPEQLIFSGTGLREGMLYDQLAPATRQMDPLISGCREIGKQTGRFATEKEFLDLAKWLMPLFVNPSAKDAKMVQAACLLSDVGWFEHEDHRPRHAYQRILNMPLYGLSHKRRALLALGVYVRHQGYLRTLERGGDELTYAAQTILNKHQRELAVQLGLGMRLAYILTGGALALLKHAELKVTPKYLHLTLTGKHAGISGDIIQGLLDDLAGKIGRDAKISLKA